MAGLRHVAFGCALGLAGLAYLVHEPLPDGLSNAHALRVYLVAVKVGTYVGRAVQGVGCDGVGLMRVLISAMAWLLQPASTYDVATQDMEWNGVPVRVFTPMHPPEGAGHSQGRALLFLHCGGFVFGETRAHDGLCRMLAHDLNAKVIYVSYRLAPEHVFPAAFDDAFTAAEYLVTHAAQIAVDPQRIAVIGASAGGNLAAAVSQELKRGNITPQPKLQVLIEPSLQATDLDMPSMRGNRGNALLTRDQMIWYHSTYLFGHHRYFHTMLLNNHTNPASIDRMRHTHLKPDYLPQDQILRDYNLEQQSSGENEFWNEHKDTFLNPDYAPLMAKDEDLAGLPSAVIVSCQYDVIRDDAFYYAARLREQGVAVEHVNLQACVHGWFRASLIHNTPAFREHYNTLVRLIHQHL